MLRKPKITASPRAQHRVEDAVNQPDQGCANSLGAGRDRKMGKSSIDPGPTLILCFLCERTLPAHLAARQRIQDNPVAAQLDRWCALIHVLNW